MSVILETSLGDIIIDLLVDTAPEACENFIKLCKVKYYNFSPVHSVQKNFSFQTGDPIGPDSKDSDGGTSIWGLLSGQSKKTFVAEIDSKLKHTERGTVSMATVPSQKDADERLAGSQFLITLGDNLDFLDGKAAIFGRVAEGFDTLEKINDAFTDSKGRPLKDIRIRHTVVLEDPFEDPPGLVEPDKSPLPSKAQLATVMIADDEELDNETDEATMEKLRREREARAQALTLEMVGDLPFAEVKPPENILFVCKLNPVTQDEDLRLIFSRFGKILSCEVIRDKRTGDSLQYAFIEFEHQKDCEQAYFKMQGVLIDDHRIHVDFSQSVSKLSDTWRDSTNSKRAKHSGGFGGISSLEKKRQYRAGDERGRPSGYGMVFDKDDMRNRGQPEPKRRSRSRSPRYDDRPRNERARGEDQTHRRSLAGLPNLNSVKEAVIGRLISSPGAFDMAASMVNNLLEKLSLTSSEQKAPAQEPREDELKQLREKYEKANQEHVFAFYDELSTQDKASLFEQLQTFDPDRINVLADKALNPPKSSEDAKEPDIKPLPDTASASLLDLKSEEIEEWYKAGLALIAQNKVAVLLMAGGQGTRLGSSAPKGCFDIGLPSKKSLFQVQAERIWKVQQLARKISGSDTAVSVPWYVMTSGPTRVPTEEFFEENNYFGLPKENVIIFEQGVLPCISNEGKILMESKSKVAVAPDGNGGIYQALLLSNARTDMRKRGIEHIHAYCVDNCLVKVADPTFIGFSAAKDVDIATKVVRKRSAKEPVGLILLKNGRPDVVEYSEIDKQLAEAKETSNPDLLKFRAANIVNHYYSFRFIETIEEWAHKLPHHVAKKKIPYMDTEKGETVKPDKANGIKLEQFVFDVFPFLELKQFACLEVDRQEEFSPLKNAKGTGEDDPDTSKRDMIQQGARWVRAAGATVTSESDAPTGVEVSPLISYGGEGLEHLKGQEIKSPAVIEKSR